MRVRAEGCSPFEQHPAAWPTARRRFLQRRIGLGAALVFACLWAGTVEADEGATSPLPPPRVRRLLGPGGTPLPAPDPVRSPQEAAAFAPPPRPAPAPVPFAPGFARAEDLVPGAAPVPVQGPTRGRAGAPAGPEDFSAGLPPEAPPRPADDATPQPGEVGFEVARPGGSMRVFRDADNPEQQRVVVMIGNPRIERPRHERSDSAGRSRTVEKLEIQANQLVAWIDRAGFPGVDAHGELRGRTDVPVPEAAVRPGEKPARKTASVIPDFLLGIYAEGAVLLKFGEQEFRAEALYIDPQAFQGFLQEPRIDGRVLGVESPDPRGLPVYLRARGARLVSRGLVVLEQAEVSTSRSDDRVVLQAETLVVEEHAPRHGPDGAERPHLLGFQAESTQRYVAKTIVVRGERLPIFWLSELDFGLSEAGEAFPTVLKGARAGSQSHLGRFGFIDLGGKLGPSERPVADWLLGVGGYTRRGPALLPELSWHHLEPGAPLRSMGRVEGFLLAEQDDRDRTGFEPPAFRHRTTLESRTWLRDDLRLDVEGNFFGDRGVQNEFFERDDLEHKDRESYVRLDWRPARPGNVVATLTGKAHVRDFVTETTEEPQLGVWVQSLPLWSPAYRGAPSFDLVSNTFAGRLARRFDEALSAVDVEAWRLSNDTMVAGTLPLGDLRLVGTVGVSLDRYMDVEGLGERDLERAALRFGLVAHGQAHRTQPGVRGGAYGLDGLRHVIDYEASWQAREGSGPEGAELPPFDRREQERDRHTLGTRWRSRWQTRRAGGGLRDVLDAQADLALFVDDRGPRGLDTPGLLTVRLRGEPRTGLRFDAEAEWDLASGIESAYGRAEWRTLVEERALRLSVGYGHVDDLSDALTFEGAWRFSDRYALEALSHFELGPGDDVHRLLFRRFSEDHAIAFGVEMRGGDLQLEISFAPAIGGLAEQQRPLFRDVFDPSTSRSSPP